MIDAAWPLEVMLTVFVVLPDPNARLTFSGFGLAARPVVLPVPTVKLTAMLIVPCCVLVDPAEAVSVSGFGLATRPDVPPLPTVRLTVMDRLPFGVTTA